MIGLKNIDQNSAPLFEAVKKYIDDKVIPFHVPGHKHGRGIRELTEYVGEKILQMDVNGMSDLDYFNNPIGVIYDAEKLFADAYGAKEAFFLVNGTTSGIQAMIMSICKPNDEIILPRNAHKSAISGIILSGAMPIYIEPEISEDLGIANGVTPEKVEAAIKSYPNAKAVFLVSPTYYGYTSDIQKIVEIAHNNNMKVLVDEAHGPHMYFHEDFPLTAIEQGADMCAISMHKTGGSLTQSSVLLMGDTQISAAEVKQALNLLFTSSASYLLMCSLDIARKQMATEGRKLLQNALELARWGRDELNKIDGIYAFGRELIGNPGCADFDDTKLGINVRGLGYTGYQMETKLRREYNIQIELADLNNILAIISIGDRIEDIKALVDSLKDISKKSQIKDYGKVNDLPKFSKTIVSPRKAYYMDKELVKLSHSVDRIAGEMIMAYPPGIPILCIGELITKEIIDYIDILKNQDCELQGTSDTSVDYIKVLI